MPKPGLTRAIPMALIGFALGALAVLILRTLQNMDPVWDAGVALVVTPFTTTWLFLWGMGAFDPRMSEHGEHAEHAIVAVEGAPAHEHHEEEMSPFKLLLSQVWQVTTLSLLAVIIVFAIAALPLGLHLQDSADPAANRAAIDTQQTFLLPLGVGEFQASQLTVFLGFVAFTMVSVLAFAGLIALAFYNLNREVKTVQAAEPDVKALTPPAPVRWTGRLMGNIARGLKRGLPAFFGYRN